MRLLVRLFWVALFVGVLVLGWTFRAENEGPVTVSYAFGQFPPVPQWLALLAAFAVGAAAAGLIGLYQVAKLRLVARRYRKTVRGLEAEVHQLRTLPLSSDEPALASAGERPLEDELRGARGRGG
jgi:uncharacterized integral membrane protein